MIFQHHLTFNGKSKGHPLKLMEISIFAPPLNCYTQLLSKTRCWVHLNYNHISVFALLPQKFLFIHPCQRTPKHHMALNGNFNGHPIY